ncbi:MAG: nitrate transporter substrate-binding protein [Homoserinimonas sp.]|nr:nitrate transporter substrate-binding protein [Homoserinimonas sp.]
MTTYGLGRSEISVKKKTRAGSATALVACMMLPGCSALTADSEKLMDATVGVIPISDTAPLYLGLDQGFFAEEGINLTITSFATGGANIVPAVVDGDYQFGFSNMLSLMAANEDAATVKIVSPAVASSGDTSLDFGAVIVRADSDIQQLADLEGKTISNNSVGNINDTVIRTLVDNAGADSATITFTEVPFPNAAAALEAGTVDAAFVVEPFVTAAKAAGHRVLNYTYASFDPKLDVAAYFASAKLMKQNPELVARFQAAVTKSLEFAESNDDLVRDIIGTYAKTPATVGKSIVLPTFPVRVDRASASLLGDQAVKYGVLKSAPDLDLLLP